MACRSPSLEGSDLYNSPALAFVHWGIESPGDVEQHQVSFDDYASQRLVQIQEQVLTQNQEQVKLQAR